MRAEIPMSAIADGHMHSCTEFHLALLAIQVLQFIPWAGDPLSDLSSERLTHSTCCSLFRSPGICIEQKQASRSARLHLVPLASRC